MVGKQQQRLCPGQELSRSCVSWCHAGLRWGARPRGQDLRGGLGSASGANALGRSILWAPYFLPDTGTSTAAGACSSTSIGGGTCSEGKHQDETAVLGESPRRLTLARNVSRLCEGGSAPSPQHYKPRLVLSEDGCWGDPLAPDAAVPGQQLWQRSALIAHRFSPDMHCGTGITSVTHIASA